MGIRNIRVMGDPILNKKSRQIKEITPKIKELIEDMFDTMYKANGVGLAGVQVGVLKRIVVIDISEERNQPLLLINPVIVEERDSQTGEEGCLSVPNKSGVVTRPNYVKVKAYDKDLKEFEIEGEELLARALCHEIDHLDGHLYVEKVEGDLISFDDIEKSETNE